MIIDCDTHFMPKDAFDYVEGPRKDQRPVLRINGEGLLAAIDFPGMPPKVTGTTPLPAPGSGAKNLGLCDIEVRMKDYDSLGIESHFILPQFSGWWSYLIEPELAVAVARSYNQSMLRLMRAYPGKIFGVALMPLQDVARAVEELEWAKQNGFRAAVLDKVYPVREHPYSDALGCHRELWPFFQKAEALGMPLFLHNVQHGHRLSNLLPFQRDGLNFFAPSEGQVSLVSLFTSGLLDEFPKLSFIYTEAGTAFIKPLVQRLDAAYETAPVDYDEEEPIPKFVEGGGNLQHARAIVPLEVYQSKNKHLPSHYFRHNFYFTIETEEPELAEAVSLLGPERFLFATDYPHDDPGGRMKFKDLKLLQKNASLTESDKRRILSENATKLFQLAALHATSAGAHS